MANQRQIYADRVVEVVQNILSTILMVIQVLWFVSFIFVVSGLLESQVGQSITNWIDKRVAPRYGGQLLLIVLAPFIAPVIVNMTLFILKWTRRLFFITSALRERAEVQVVKKETIHRTSSETEWDDYYLTVPHPRSESLFTFYVDEYTIRKYEKGDRIRVAFNQKFQSILILEPEQTV